MTAGKVIAAAELSYSTCDISEQREKAVKLLHAVIRSCTQRPKDLIPAVRLVRTA